MTPRENAEAKGLRYLTQGRLVITHVSEKAIRATCRGSGELHSVGWLAGAGWSCSCSARSRCSHLVALHSVTVIDRMAR